MGTWVRERGLLLANLGLFFLFFVGMAVFGFNVYNEDQSSLQPPCADPHNPQGTAPMRAWKF